MINIIKNFLTNQIVVNWIAPIITGLIVVAIPTFLIRVFQLRKDKRKVDDANQRYLNSIRPYIIQKIHIDKRFISDVRRVIVKESCIKEKYIYTEIELRDKLILDITEDNYINEMDKKELFDFTYDVFKEFSEEQVSNKDVSKNKVKSFMIIDKYIIVLIISLVICTIIQMTSEEGADLNKNMTFGLSYIVAFFSLCITLMSYLNISFKSKVSSETSFKEKFLNLFFEEVEEKDELKQNKNKTKCNK